MRRLKIIFVYKLTICVLSWFLLVGELDALRGSAVVLQAKSKAEKKISDDEVIELDENGEQIVSNVTVVSTKPTLTGIPQIDYVHDPNLPRELNGYNLTDYPFLNSVPEEIEFKCDGLHDGFYASVPHKCQLYHHCLFGTRFDFLCANYTAFDQKTFICHFVSQIDCNSSPKYFNRNEALYKAAETTTTSTTTTTTTTVAPPRPPQQQQQQQYQPQYQQQPYEGRRVVAGGYAQGRKRRPPYRRRRPIYEYYYVDDEYDDQEYYDDPVEHVPMVKKPTRKSSRLNNYKPVDLEAEYAESSSESDRPNDNEPVQQQHQQQHQHQQQEHRASSAVNTKNASNQITSVYDKPRAPPKIRRPVPINERDRYDYTARTGGQQTAAVAPSTTTTTTTSTTTTTTAEPPGKSKGKIPPPPTAAAEPEYYDEDEEEYVEEETAGAGKVESAANAKGARPDDYEETDRVDKRRPSSSSPPPPPQPQQTPASSIRSKLLAKAPVAKSPPPPFAVSLRKKPVAERVEEYEDEVPAATRQATTKRTTGAHAMRPKGPVVRSSAADEAVYHQPPRVSARHASRPRAQADHYKPTRMASRRPARPVYEYADEYYDE
ncbi:uncharacterized protein LOC126846634 [Adelges cooleyi]|uniref:uncharacterized protein LOC126846634 n=1 Tax=Adelges cooleyi TaxID=133065 RepID=UPI00217FBEAF|nr:uncharacterized protein LOC126846634 [Adelges cooleyi]